jgi:tetratricopeptide (TPR) repeat protein
MKTESIAYIVAGACFGVILGWLIGSQQAAVRPAAPAAAPTASASPSQRPTPTLDEGRVQALTTIVKNDPNNADAVVQLANTYFDGERWDDAITWYERALQIKPQDADISTDLGVSYYYTNRPDQALSQFEQSLKIDPQHTKTLLNKGIVLAFGKENLSAAAEEWKKVVTLAPDSQEGQAARKMLEGLASAHAGEPPSNQ